MDLLKFSDNVYFAADAVVSLEASNVEDLKRDASSNGTGSVRICMHTGVDARLHEMLIVHSKNTYIRPHKHIGKSISFHVVEGFADLIVFDESGAISSVNRISEHRSGGTFYFRISDERYYTQLIKSEILAFHETTVGPFRREDTVWAPWAPPPDDRHGAVEYLGQLTRRVDEYCRARDPV